MVEVLYLLQICVYEITSGNIYWDPLVPKVKKEIDKGNIYVIKVNNISVGLTMLETSHNKSLHIPRIIVHPKWLGKGVENELIHFAEKYARENGFESLHFEVFAENIPVINVFDALSYKKADETHLPLQIVPVIGMEKKIN